MIVCSALSFSWPDDTPVFDRLSFTVGPGRTGLVAPNGAGKSTLLKLVAGVLTPGAGSVSVEGTLGYLPQSLPLVADRTVAEVLEIAPVVAALRAIEGGDASEENFALVGNDWDVEERARAELHRLGLGDVSLDRPTGTLSGGQVVSLGLAAQLVRRPDVLLLDEPTNNLDRDARLRLYSVVEEWSGCLLLVSHDRALLDRMDRIAELERGEVTMYGGGFTDYEQAVTSAREVAERNIRSAEQEVKREKRELQQARERAARRASNASRNLKSAGLARIVAGGLKRKAQESAAKADDTHARRLSDAKSKLDDAERALRDDQRITLSLPDTNVPAGRTVFLGESIGASRGGRSLFADTTLAVRGPERIALVGPNGAGKSTLLRIVNGDLRPDTGTTTRGHTAYLSQRLDLLDPEVSVLDNLHAFAPTMSRSDTMNLLARFLFKGARTQIPVSALSGGERMRATLACVLSAEPAPQLLLLDEPTNNLDLSSVAWLEQALSAYEGAFIVVSHDDRFLSALGIDRTLRLMDGRLVDEPGHWV